MADLAENEVYIRPCGAFPDGYVVSKQVAERLLYFDLVTPDDGWRERGTPEGDMQAVYDPLDDDDMETVADLIEQIAANYGR